MPRLRRCMAVLAVALLSACASGGMGEGDARPSSATILVNNNLAIPAVLTVHLVPERGGRRLLGNVSPGASTTLSVPGSLTGGRYRLMATLTSGADLVSDPFTLSEGERVTWNLQSNIVIVGRP